MTPKVRSGFHCLGLFIVGFLSFLFGCDKKPSTTQTPPPQQVQTPPIESNTIDYEPAEAFLDLRNLALSLQPENLNLPADHTEPIAILMETGYEDAAVTLACVVEGSTSLYFSNGGGVIGAGEHESVRKATFELFEGLPAYLQHFEPVSDTPLPLQGKVTFYVITADGIKSSGPINEDDLGYQRHNLAPLFILAHEVLAQVRMKSPN